MALELNSDQSYSYPQAENGKFVKLDKSAIPALSAFDGDVYATLTYCVNSGEVAPHTHTSSDITDFSSAVTGNAAVVANTAKRSYPIEDEAALDGLVTLVPTIQDELRTKEASDFVQFDGASAYSVLPITSPGSSDFSISVNAFLPATLQTGNARRLIQLTSSSTAAGVGRMFQCAVSSSGSLLITLYGADAGSARVLTSTTSVFSSLLGEQANIIISFTKSVAPKVFLNGYQVTFNESTVGTPPSWSDVVTGDYLILGRYISDYAKCGYKDATVFNFALSDTEVSNLNKLGIDGFLAKYPEYGNSYECSADAFSFVSATNNGSASVTKFDFVTTSAYGNQRIKFLSSLNISVGQKIRVKMSGFSKTGGTSVLQPVNYAGTVTLASSQTISGDGIYTFTITTASTDGFSILVNNTLSGATVTSDLDSVNILGSSADLKFDDSAGRLLPNRNGDPALMFGTFY